MTTTNGKVEQFTANQLDRLEAIVGNAITSRNEFFKKFADPRRNIEEECGHPTSVQQITAWDYQDLYDKEPIASRVVEVLPRESWQTTPIVYELEDPGKVTPFEAAWDNLVKGSRGEHCYYQDEEGSPIWEYLRRGDERSGIGSFGVILLGFDDGLPLGMPVGGAMAVNRVERPVTVNFASGQQPPTKEQLLGTETPVKLVGGRKEGLKLLYLRVFSEYLVQIAQYESDPRSPRYGQPIRYALNMNDPRGTHSGIGMPMSTLFVHWSRILHLADNLQDSEIFGRPRMQPVMPRLFDLRKIYGGDAEAYWKNMVMRIFLETHPQLGGDVEVDKTGLREMMENMENGLQRWAALMGMSAKTVAPSVVDPTSHINVQIEAICIQLGIPKRVFMGSERGELASTQDDAAWNDRLKYRQHNYITPRVIVPFIDRLIAVGVLPVPSGYSVVWPDLTSQSDGDRAAIAVQKTTALAQYVGGGVEALIPPMPFLTTILGMDDEEAGAILTEAKEALASQPLTLPEPTEEGGEADEGQSKAPQPEAP